MRTRQRGGALGTFIVIVLLVAGGYYAYTEFFSTASKSPPSCKQTLNSCIASCRKISTEAPALQACQESCQPDAASCK